MYIKGVGMTKFDYSQKPWWKFAYEAALEALEDAKMKASQLDAIVLSTISNAGGGEHQTHKTSLLSDLFKTHVPIIETPSVCSGGGVAFWTANRLNFKNVLALSGERSVYNRTEVATDLIMSAAERVFEQTEGMIFPAQNALVWQKYAEKYQATMDDLSLIAFKNHQNAALNPKAYYYKRSLTLEEIKKSPEVASPLRLMDCSLSVNGGSAAILTQEKTNVEVAGSGFATDYLLTFGRDETDHFPATRLAASQAYSQAGITAKDIDVAELHDAFTPIELFSYEDLGFAPVGHGADLIRSGKVNLGGEMPINTSGGLKAKGHPISATGLAQIYEITRQLRGQCGDRQVKNAEIGLCQNIGGAGGTITVNILRKVK